MFFMNGTANRSADLRLIGWSCLAIVAALLAVGTVSHGVIRHSIQTSALWPGIVLAFRRHPLSKWMALPPLLFWLAVMLAIWLFLLGWVQLVHGSFSATEIAMTLVVGVASVVGILSCFRARSSVKKATGFAIFVLLAILQIALFRLSLLPVIAHR